MHINQRADGVLQTPASLQSARQGHEKAAPAETAGRLEKGRATLRFNEANAAFQALMFAGFLQLHFSDQHVPAHSIQTFHSCAG